MYGGCIPPHERAWVDGRRWLTLEGHARVMESADAVRDGEDRYAERYRRPRPNPQRVVLVIAVDRALGALGVVAESVPGQAAATTRSSTTRSRNASTDASR